MLTLSLVRNRYALAAAALLVAVVPHLAHAQADTLDWHRYFPLDVGNVWEYQDAEAWSFVTRYDLVADTVIDGRAYVVREVRKEYTGPPASLYRDLVRYDEDSGTVISVRNAAADTVAAAPCSYDSEFARDLRLAIGARVACPPGGGEPGVDSVFVDGQADSIWTPPGGGSVEVAAVKTITLDGLWFTRFVADIGPVGEGNLWGPRLRYARIGGVEYGTPHIIVSDEAAPTATSGLELRAVSPMRPGSTLRLRARAATLTEARIGVFDALGRRVAQTDATLGTDWRPVALEAMLSSGIYHVRIMTDGEQTTVPLTVVR